MNFEQLGLLPELLKGLEAKGYTKTTAIQAQAIPVILQGRDLMGGAQTGTGKTAAFALPILQKLTQTEAHQDGSPRALILAPTRELSEQVGESFKTYGQFLDLRITKLYGGAKMSTQLTSLKRGTDIVIATPGRLMDHLQQKNIDLSKIEMLVLDEADRMLDMGFINDINAILEFLPKKSQNLLFSATYGQDIEKLAKVLLKNPVSMEVSKRNTAAVDVRQVIHFVDKGERFNLLAHLINEGQWYQVLIFVKTKESAERVNTQLNKAGIPSDAIHGDKSQGARNRALRNFKSGDLQALVATDVAARGIDLKDLSHVVNFELPQIPEDYIHRIGRTGRAGKSGVAISLVSFSEKNQLLKIEKILKSTIPQEIVPGFEPKHDINKVLKKKSKAASAGEPVNQERRSASAGAEGRPARRSASAGAEGRPGRKPASAGAEGRPGRKSSIPGGGNQSGRKTDSAKNGRRSTTRQDKTGSPFKSRSPRPGSTRQSSKVTGRKGR